MQWVYHHKSEVRQSSYPTLTRGLTTTILWHLVVLTLIPKLPWPIRNTPEISLSASIATPKWLGLRINWLYFMSQSDKRIGTAPYNIYALASWGGNQDDICCGSRTHYIVRVHRLGILSRKKHSTRTNVHNIERLCTENLQVISHVSHVTQCCPDPIRSPSIRPVNTGSSETLWSEKRETAKFHNRRWNLRGKN